MHPLACPWALLQGELGLKEYGNEWYFSVSSEYKKGLPKLFLEYFHIRQLAKYSPRRSRVNLDIMTQCGERMKPDY